MRRDSLFPERNTVRGRIHMRFADLGAASGIVAQVTVTAPGRLHLGFLDPDATSGRRFGSIGLAIDAPCTRLALRLASEDRVDAEPGTDGETGRAREYLAALKRLLARPAPIAMHLQEVLPAHAGLGSGTQLALALGRAFAALHGLDPPAAELARALGRGRRSAIGVAAFERGGLLLDGGVRGGTVAPLIARAEFPANWCVLLVCEPAHCGLHGADEADAIARLAPMPGATAAGLSHLALMQILPAAHEADFDRFARGVTELQHVVGAHFAPAQGGSMYASAAVRQLVEWLGANDHAGVGQSSWGPTGFAVFPSNEAALEALDRARRAGRIDPALALRLVRGRNHGARVAR